MAAGALLAARGSFPINVKYVFEGEEESSSVHLDHWLEAERDRLAADVAIISDTGFFEGNLPAITLSLRGLMYAQIDVVGTAVDLHSGSYGGAVQNPANALAVRSSPGSRAPTAGSASPASTTTSCRCPRRIGRPSRRCPFDEDAYQAHLGLPALVGEAGFTTLERRAARPTLDVNGIWGGFEGEGSKTIIPAHAHAKVSCRLVAAQDPDRIFEAFRAYVEEIAPPGVTTTVQHLGGGLPSLTPMDHPATQAAARALEATFGQAPVYIREGGSIPVCASFALDPRPPGRAHGLHAAGRECPRPERVDGPRATTRRASGRSPGCSTSWSTCRADGRRTGLCGNGTFGWVFGPNAGATMRRRSHPGGSNLVSTDAPDATTTADAPKTADAPQAAEAAAPTPRPPRCRRGASRPPTAA